MYRVTYENAGIESQQRQNNWYQYGYPDDHTGSTRSSSAFRICCHDERLFFTVIGKSWQLFIHSSFFYFFFHHFPVSLNRIKPVLHFAYLSIFGSGPSLLFLTPSSDSKNNFVVKSQQQVLFLLEMATCPWKKDVEKQNTHQCHGLRGG